MSPEQIALQLGIAGLLVIVGYRVALVFIARWGTVEDARTKTLDANLSTITSSMNRVHEGQARLEGKLDAVLGFPEPEARSRVTTRPKGIPIYRTDRPITGNDDDR